MTPGKGSKYREFYDLSGRITCMVPSSQKRSELIAENAGFLKIRNFSEKFISHESSNNDKISGD